MQYTVKSLWGFIMNNKPEEMSQKVSLTRENAYALASIGKKKGHYSDITKEYQEYVLRQIKSAAGIGENYVLINHPSYITPTDKESIVDFVSELGYSICFINDDVMLLSWKYSPNDFNK